MCGRFYVADDDALGEMVRRLSRKLNVELKTGEICPNDSAAVFVREGSVKLKALTWGFRMDGGKLLINARSESAHAKPMFRELIRANRLIVPASHYFEWDGARVRHSLGMPDGIYMAGLFRPGDERFVILTREASDTLRPIHSRMPVIFKKEAALHWLDPNMDAMGILERSEVSGVGELNAQTRLQV